MALGETAMAHAEAIERAEGDGLEMPDLEYPKI